MTSSRSGKLFGIRTFLAGSLIGATFSQPRRTRSAGATQGAEGTQGLNVGVFMKLVSRHAKQGAQLTPQGVLRWPLSAPGADVVLRETRELLAMLDGRAS